MAWTAHAKADAPAPSWAVHPTRITLLHPRLTELTPAIVQALGQQKDITVDSTTATVDDHIVTKWKRRGVCPWSTGDQTPDPSGHNWTEQEQPDTPQQNNFVNTYATSLACGVRTVLSSLYAVREWSVDFVEQSHISNARNWMAAVCHEIKETVSLERCKCGESYEQWGRRPAPPCSKCEKTHVRKASAGETCAEQGRSKGKRAKCDSSGGKGEKKRQNIQYPTKTAKKINTQPDIRYAFFDPAHGPRVRLSAASLSNPLQAPVLRQEVDHDPMPKDVYHGLAYTC